MFISTPGILVTEFLLVRKLPLFDFCYSDGCWYFYYQFYCESYMLPNCGLFVQVYLPPDFPHNKYHEIDYTYPYIQVNKEQVNCENSAPNAKLH